MYVTHSLLGISKTELSWSGLQVVQIRELVKVTIDRDPSRQLFASAASTNAISRTTPGFVLVVASSFHELHFDFER